MYGSEAIFDLISGYLLIYKVNLMLIGEKLVCFQFLFDYGM